MGDTRLSVGDMAPDVGGEIWPEGSAQLSDYRGKWVIIYFYPRDNTPGCTTESCAFRDALPDVQAADAVVLGVSRDSVKSHGKFTEKQALNFPLISDPDEVVCQAFGVMQMKKLYGKEYMGVERSTFIIDPQGKVSHVWRKVKVKGHVDEVLETLKGLQ